MSPELWQKIAEQSPWAVTLLALVWMFLRAHDRHTDRVASELRDLAQTMKQVAADELDLKRRILETLGATKVMTGLVSEELQERRRERKADRA